jgi:hypothetical protein
MRLTTWLLILAAAPLPGVLLALADLRLGLGGDAVSMFAILCVGAATGLGALAIGGFLINPLRRADVDDGRSLASAQ